MNYRNVATACLLLLSSTAFAEDEEGTCRSDAVNPIAPDTAFDPIRSPARLRIRLDGDATDVAISSGDELVVTDAGTGNLLWSSEAVSEEIRVLLATGRPLGLPAFLEDARGFAYRGYFADGAGTIWRLDLPGQGAGESPALWTLQPFARLTGEGQLRLDQPPALVRSIDRRGRPFDGLLLVAEARGTDGALSTVFYFMRDYDLEPHAPIAEPLKIADLADASSCRDRKTVCPRAESAGWRVAVSVAGRLPVGRALIEGGRVFLTTYDASTENCLAGDAETQLHVLTLETGSAAGGSGGEITLGRQRPKEVRLRDGMIWWPGRITRQDNPGSEWAAIRGAGVFVLYWRDLQIDAD